MRLAMSIDLDRCVGCKACVAACKEQWDSGPGAARDWVGTIETGKRGKDLAVTFYPGLCMQCEEHPCTVDCPTGATYADPKTGVVMVDAGVCIGCGNCVSSCPYGARHVDPVKKVVEKCNLCAPFVARGEQPACVATCPAECRAFGDVDDPGSAVTRAVRQGDAKPLVTADVNVGPKTTYAGRAHRDRILASGAVKQPTKSGLTSTWGLTLPIARNVVPALGLAFVGGGLLVNLKARSDRVKRQETATPPPTSTPTPTSAPTPTMTARGSIPRHRPGVRFLHWFNALSWVVLVATGTGLMASGSFALFGTAFPRAAARAAGGPANVMRLHVLWGLLWAAVVVPMFLLFKKGPREVLSEVRLTRDDLAWLFTKPLAMSGLRKQPLPPQDKYNAGQKLFALLVLVATALIIASGLVMTFHVGTAAAVSGAIVVHELAIALVLLGVAIHVTMAAVIAEERPALRSMITGRIDHLHAERHSPKWVAELELRRAGPTQGDTK